MNLNKAESSTHEYNKENVLEHLFLTYKEPLYHFIFRYTQEEQLSIDIVQDTFLKFKKYESRFDEEKSSIKTYLFRIAYQLMVNRLKRRERWKKVIPFLYRESIAESFSIEDRLTVQEAVAKLSQEHRAVILLTYYHDLPQAEIAKILEIPVGTVKSRLHNGLSRLKRLMEGEQ